MLDKLLSLGGSSAGARPKVMILQLSNDKKRLLSGSSKLHSGYEIMMIYSLKFKKFANEFNVANSSTKLIESSIKSIE